MRLEEQLEQEMLKIAALKESTKNFKNYDEEQKARDVSRTANIVGGEDKKAVNKFITETINSPEAYILKTEGAINSIGRAIEDAYNANKGIIGIVIDRLNADLADARDGADAIYKIADAFRSLLMPKVHSQEHANSIFARALGIPAVLLTESRPGDLEKAQEMLYRTELAEYIVDNGEGNFSINSGKVKELMKDSRNGSVLYGYVKAAEAEEARQADYAQAA